LKQEQEVTMPSSKLKAMPGIGMKDSFEAMFRVLRAYHGWWHLSPIVECSTS